MPQIYIEKMNGKWYYSSETIAGIDKMYNDVFPLYVVKLQDIIPFSGYNKFFASLQFGLTINTWVFTIINIATTIFWIYILLKLVHVVMLIYEEVKSLQKQQKVS